MIEHFHFLRPLWLLAAVPALALTLWLWRTPGSDANWRRAIAPELLDYLLDTRGERRVRWPWWLVFAGWALGSIALAGPTWEKLPQPVLQKRDALVVVFDLSLSMNATDLQPSRLQRARYKLLDVLTQRKEGLTGLVVYAGDAHVVTPLTDDTDTIANLVPALAPTMMPLYGSDVRGGIDAALQLLQSSGVARGRLLLITDGIESDDVDAVAERLRGSTHALSILGVGTTQGAPIPIDGGFLKNSDGSIAVPQLPRDRLQQLANRSGGNYSDLRPDDADLTTLLPNTEISGNELRATERKFDQWRERGPWLVLMLLPLAALAFRRGWLLVVLAALLALPPDVSAQLFEQAASEQAASEQAAPAQPGWRERGAQLWRNLWQTPDQQAAQKLEQGDASGAAAQFTDPDWRASAHYRAGDYEQAAQSWQTPRAADGKPTATADYNRGNALARAGQLEAAIAAYDDALKKDPTLADAKANRELVEKLLQDREKTESDKQQDASGQNPQQEENNSQQGNNDEQRKPQAGDQKPTQDAAGNEHNEQQQTSTSEAQSSDPQQQREQQQREQQQREQQQRQQKPADQQAQKAPDKTQQQQPTDNSLDKKPDAKPRAGEPGQPAPMTAEQQRQQQVLEQWLQQIPDEPEGLLRRKFDYEHRQRAREREPAPDRPLY